VPVLAILKALTRAVRRDLATFQSIAANNFFFFVALLMYGAFNSGTKPSSSYPFLLLLGFLMLFPLSSDPLARIPRVRIGLWPLTRFQRFLLRLASLVLSPVLWVTLLLILKTSPSLALFFATLAIGAQALIVLAAQLAERAPRWNPVLQIPQIPGALGGLIRNNARQMLSVLDPYIALLLSVGGCAYRFLTANPDPASLPILSLLIALAVSTYAQCLFGLDSAAAMERYRLLPLRGWQILLAKDSVYLAIVFLLVLPLAPVAVQSILGFAIGFAESQSSLIYFFAAAAAWLVSLYWTGRKWDR
jgi:hypothetical protein